MATLNGVEFGILSKTTSIIHDNIITDIPGSDTIVVNDLGYSTEPMTITGHVKNETEFDNFKEQYYSGGALTLIIDPDSGKQYKVFALRNITELDGQRTYPLTDIVFNAVFHMQTPYKEATELTTRSKTITANNQEWSQDDDGRDIKTLGNVDAVPDIKVIGGTTGGYHRLITAHEDRDATEYSENVSTDWVLVRTWTYPATAQRYYILDAAAFDLKSGFAGTPVWGKCTYEAASLGAETLYIDAMSTITTYATKSATDNIQSAIGEALIVRFYIKRTGTTVRMTLLESDVDEYYDSTCLNVQVYNTADTTIKCDVGDLLFSMVRIINTDGTGTVDYDDYFTDPKYLYDATHIGITHDTTDDELDIADDGYIYWLIDTKYPITGIPTLTAQINITAGTPTIQISTDAVTWYDIDTAIVDDVDTEYPLDNAANLSLAGKTSFYLRFDCVKAGAATCSIKHFELDINMHTVYAKNPIINKGGVANTFRCDQDTNSGLACEVELSYRNRWWS